MASVELQQVSKVYDNQVRALNDANLVIEDKSFTVLVGPSGCGKSTMLRMIAGLEDITAGDIYIDGIRVNDIPAKKRDIAMVFQNYALYPHMTVFENMAFGLKLRKYPKTEIRERVTRAAELLHIDALFDRRPKALSGGQRQRVAVGRSIVRQPKVFLFDEPLSNLDAKLRVQMRIEINRLHQQLETTMIYVTHDQIEAMTMGSRIVVLKDGYIQQVDAPLDLYNNPVNQFVAGFIGSPSMNFFNGRISGDGSLMFKNPAFSLQVSPEHTDSLSAYRDQEVTLGIRPEDMIPLKPGETNDRLIQLSDPIAVEVVEPVGNEIFLYFSSADQTYCLRTDPEHRHQPGDSVNLAFRRDKMYFFERDTEKRIV